MALTRMDNVLMVVDDLEAVKTFFLTLSLTLEGETIVEGPSNSADVWRRRPRP